MFNSIIVVQIKVFNASWSEREREREREKTETDRQADRDEQTDSYRQHLDKRNYQDEERKKSR